MRVARFALSFLVVLSASPPLNSQQSTSAPTREAQALALLAQSLKAAGGVSAIGAIQDFVGTGTITYYWAGEKVQGAATVKGRGIHDFRLDSNLPDGTQSWTVASGKGSLKSTNGKIRQIPFYNAINFGSLTLPFIEMVNILNDSSVSVSLADQEQINGRTVYRIRVKRNFDAVTDPSGIISGWTLKDYLLDATTLLPIEVTNTVHPAETHLQGYLHEVIFSDYRSQGGVILPFSITEKVGGQSSWEIQLNSITLNNRLTDSVFAQ